MGQYATIGYREAALAAARYLGKPGIAKILAKEDESAAARQAAAAKAAARAGGGRSSRRCSRCNHCRRPRFAAVCGGEGCSRCGGPDAAPLAGQGDDGQIKYVVSRPGGKPFHAQVAAKSLGFFAEIADAALAVARDTEERDDGRGSSSGAEPQWVECGRCGKWRRTKMEVSAAADWFCELDPKLVGGCDVPEEDWEGSSEWSEKLPELGAAWVKKVAADGSEVFEGPCGHRYPTLELARKAAAAYSDPASLVGQCIDVWWPRDKDVVRGRRRRFQRGDGEAHHGLPRGPDAARRAAAAGRRRRPEEGRSDRVVDRERRLPRAQAKRPTLNRKKLSAPRAVEAERCAHKFQQLQTALEEAGGDRSLLDGWSSSDTRRDGRRWVQQVVTWYWNFQPPPGASYPRSSAQTPRSYTCCRESSRRSG